MHNVSLINRIPVDFSGLNENIHDISEKAFSIENAKTVLVASSVFAAMALTLAAPGIAFLSTFAITLLLSYGTNAVLAKCDSKLAKTVLVTSLMAIGCLNVGCFGTLAYSTLKFTVANAFALEAFYALSCFLFFSALTGYFLPNGINHIKKALQMMADDKLTDKIENFQKDLKTKAIKTGWFSTIFAPLFRMMYIASADDLVMLKSKIKDSHDFMSNFLKLILYFSITAKSASVGLRHFVAPNTKIEYVKQGLLGIQNMAHMLTLPGVIYYDKQVLKTSINKSFEELIEEMMSIKEDDYFEKVVNLIYSAYPTFNEYLSSVSSGLISKNSKVRVFLDAKKDRLKSEIEGLTAIKEELISINDKIDSILEKIEKEKDEYEKIKSSFINLKNRIDNIERLKRCLKDIQGYCLIGGDDKETLTLLLKIVNGLAQKEDNAELYNLNSKIQGAQGKLSAVVNEDNDDDETDFVMVLGELGFKASDFKEIADFLGVGLHEIDEELKKRNLLCKEDLYKYSILVTGADIKKNEILDNLKNYIVKSAKLDLRSKIYSSFSSIKESSGSLSKLSTKVSKVVYTAAIKGFILAPVLIFPALGAIGFGASIPYYVSVKFNFNFPARNSLERFFSFTRNLSTLATRRRFLRADSDYIRDRDQFAGTTFFSKMRLLNFEALISLILASAYQGFGSSIQGFFLGKEVVDEVSNTLSFFKVKLS